MLDHYIETGGTFPDRKYLKNEIGHNINLLQQKANEVVTRRNLGIQCPSGPVHQAIIRLLSNFAEGDRYSNINLLTGTNRQSDPIEAWFNDVDIPLFKSRVTEQRKRKIARSARAVAHVAGGSMYVLHTSETGSDISDIEEASLRTGIYEAVAPHRQLYVLHLIRYWSDLLVKLQYPAQGLGREEVPFFSEIFAAFRNDDSYMRTRKTWDKI